MKRFGAQQAQTHSTTVALSSTDATGASQVVTSVVVDDSLPVSFILLSVLGTDPLQCHRTVQD